MRGPGRGRVTALDHIGVAVKDPRQRLPFWADLLGMELARTEDVPTEGVRTWFLEMGESHLELLEPTSETSPIAKHLEKRGEGIAHMALRVDDLDAMVARLAARGVNLLPPGVRQGAGGAKVAFLHPKDTGGVLVELSQHGADGHGHGQGHGAGLEEFGLHGHGHEHGTHGHLHDHEHGHVHDDDEDEHDHDHDFEDEPPFGPGTVAVLYLREPRERLFGVLRQLDPIGCALEGIDLESWDGWVNQWARGDEGPITPSLQFFPLARVEKILADSDTADLPSFTRRFEERTGRPLVEAFGFDVDEYDEDGDDDDEDDDDDLGLRDDDGGRNGDGRR